MRRLSLLLLAGAVVLEVGCGLPDSFYLQPPTATQIGSGQTNQTLIISGTTRGNDVDAVFQGYELYYKCFGPTDSLLSDENYGTTSNTYTDLLTAGFHRVCRGPGSGGGLAVDTYPGTQNSPLIDISRIDFVNAGNNYTVNIVLGDTAPPTFGFTTGAPVFYFSYTPPLPATTPTAGWEIRRFVPADPNFFSGLVCRTFASNPNYVSLGFTNWNATDADMNNTIYQNALSTGQIYVMFYAVSAGVGIDGTPRFSSPVYMGYSLINIFN